MQRALSSLSNEQFDLLIIGGGATGCFTARDAALRGLKVALIEARDFAGATSAHNSRLAHGGLRYLRNFEIGLVRESLRERLGLMRIAPHLVRPLPFLLPLYDAGLRERLTLRAGLSLYDMLSFDRNRLDDPAQRMPRHRWFGVAAALAREPVLEGPGFEGAFEYHDAQMYAPERIALECLIDADEQGAAIAYHLAAEKLLLRDDRVEGAAVRDALTGASFDIRAKATLVAAGPWADLFLEQATGKPAAHKLLRSKGIHLLLPSITRRNALTLQASSGVFFVMPWRGHTLLGTTDAPFDGDPASIAVDEADIAALLQTANRTLPAARLTRGDVQFFYAGLRPLVADGAGDSHDTSRRAELIDHGQEDALDGLFSALGGKWTTSRALAETVTDAVVRKLGAASRPCATATTPLPGGRFERFEALAAGFAKTYPGIASMRHLAHMHGARLPLLLKSARVGDLAALGPGNDTAAQIAFAVKEEMALTLEDVVMRRTSLGQFGKPDAAVLARAADIMGAALDWSADRKAREIESLTPLFKVRA